MQVVDEMNPEEEEDQDDDDNKEEVVAPARTVSFALSACDSRRFVLLCL